MSNPNKYLLLSVFTCLLTGALFYYKQRMLFVDPGFMAFTIINHQGFEIQEYRFGAWVTQVFPLIGSFLHLPLRWILVLYSASFPVFYLVVAGLLLFRFRQPVLALLMAFYFTLIVSAVFFWPNNEVHQGIAWMFLFFGWLMKQPVQSQRFIDHLFACLFAFFALFSHFIVWIPFLFLWLLFLLRKELQQHLSKKGLLFYSMVLVVVASLKYQLGITGWYDGPKLEGIRHLTWNKSLDFLMSGQAHTIAPLFLTNYWWCLLLFFSGVLFLLLKRKFVQLGLILLFTVGYVLLICTTYPDAFGAHLLFYMESEWMALAILATAPFAFDVFPKLKPVVSSTLLLLIFSTRFYYMLQAAPLFEQRYQTIAVITNQLHQKGISKAVLVKEKNVDSLLLMDWGTPVESLLYSTLQNYEPRVTFKLVDNNRAPLPGRDTFWSCFVQMPLQELNKRYFRPDSTQEYQVLYWSELFPSGK